MSLIAFKLLPGDVGGELIAKEDMPILRRKDGATRSGATGFLFFMIGLTATIGISTGINGMFEETEERSAVRATPIELTFAIAEVEAHT